MHPVTVVPVWELFCECGWSSCADTFAEAEDRAAQHEATVVHLTHPSRGDVA